MREHSAARVAQAAKGTGAVAACGHPAVAGSEDSPHSGQPSQRSKRPAPPDLLPQVEEGIGAPILLSVSSEHTHLTKQFLTRQPKERLDARILEGGQGETPRLEPGSPAAGQGGAVGAVTIEEDPSVASAATLAFSQF